MNLRAQGLSMNGTFTNTITIQGGSGAVVVDSGITTVTRQAAAGALSTTRLGDGARSLAEFWELFRQR
jgi:hypothetical protein